MVRKSQEASAWEGNWLRRPRFYLSSHPDFLTWGMRTDSSIWILRDGTFSHQSFWPTPLRLLRTTAAAPGREIPSPLPSKAVEWDTVMPAFPLDFKQKLTYPPPMVVTDHPGTRHVTLETPSGRLAGSASRGSGSSCGSMWGSGRSGKQGLSVCVDWFCLWCISIPHRVPGQVSAAGGSGHGHGLLRLGRGL